MCAAPAGVAFNDGEGEMSNNSLIMPDAALVTGRRALIRRGGQLALSATAVAILAGCESMASTKMANAETAQADIDTLNVALGLEHEAIAAYQVGAESGLLQKPVLDVAVGFQSDHKQHRDILASTIEKLGGTPVADMQHAFPVDKLKNQGDVLRFALGLEEGAASAYLGTVPGFSNRELAKAAASILGVETQHVAVLRSALGEKPVQMAFIA
jgi:rubrerythrin